MEQILRRLGADESGAVTVDWVVLTAAIVGLGFVTAETVLLGTENVAEATGSFVAGVRVGQD